MSRQFEDDILDEAISSNQQERSERRSKQREKKLREEERAKVAAINRKSRRKVYLIAFIVLALLAALFGRNIYQIIQLTKEKNAQQEKLLELEDSINRLNEELQRVTSDEYIEQQAREKFHMIREGEVLYVVTE